MSAPVRAERGPGLLLSPLGGASVSAMFTKAVDAAKCAVDETDDSGGESITLGGMSGGLYFTVASPSLLPRVLSALVTPVGGASCVVLLFSLISSTR